jgi:hypothetical protein
MHVDVLNRADRTNCEITKMKVVARFEERAEFVAVGAPICRRKETLPARAITVVSAKYGPVDIKPAIEVGGIQTAASGVDVNVSSGLQMGPGMSVATGEPGVRGLYR